MREEGVGREGEYASLALGEMDATENRQQD